MKSYFFLALCALLGILVAACENNKDSFPDVSNIQYTLKINRLEKELALIKTKTEAQAFLKKYPAATELFFGRGTVYSDTTVENLVLNIAKRKEFDTLMGEVNQYYGDLEDTRKELELGFKLIKHYYPDFVPPQVCTIASGFYQDIAISDSLIIIGLDYFMGKRSRYRPSDAAVYDYMFARYEKGGIAPAIMLFLAEKYNKNDYGNKSMIAQMIANGKSYYFAKKMLPRTPDSLVFRYSSKQMQDCFDHEDLIWAHFVENNLFFETSHLVVGRYMDERPFTSEIGDDCPGRIGGWLGWRIVEKYANENKDVTLQQMMLETKSQLIFEKSKYRPQVK